MSIWLDVTTLLSWRRPALGIVRVESETARCFLASNRTDLCFCRFDQVQMGYYVVSRQVLRHVLVGGTSEECGAEAIGEPGCACSPGFFATKLASKCKILARKFVDKLPRRYQSRTMLYGRWIYAQVRRTPFWRALRQDSSIETVCGKHALDSGCESALSPRLASPFSDGDTYISLGLDWDQKDLKHLYELKDRFGLKIVLCCYDIIPILFPYYCVAGVSEKFPVYFTDAAWCADVILCISSCSEKDLRAYIDSVGAPMPRMRVIRLGSNIPVVDSLSLVCREVEQISKTRFVLFVSTIERRKNHAILYDAYHHLVTLGRRDLPLLIFVGMLGWGVDDLMARIASDAEVRPFIRVLNNVSDTELAVLYRNSLFTLYPSLYEGWGLPVAESLGHGKFCLASNAASIPEIGGELVEYIDPDDSAAWAAAIVRLLDNPAELKFREQRIEKEYRPEYWDQTCSAILEIAKMLQKAE